MSGAVGQEIRTGAPLPAQAAPESPSPAEGRGLGRSDVCCPGAAVRAGLGPGVEHLVDDAESLGLVGLEELVAVHGLLDVLDLLAGIFGVELVEALAHAQDLARLDLDVGGHALGPARGLMDHDPAVGQRDAHPRLTGGEQEAAHRGGLADTYRADLGP